MTFFADLSFSQPEKPTFRRGLIIEAADAKAAVNIADAYMNGYFFGRDDACTAILESLSTRKTRGVEYVRV